MAEKKKFQKPEMKVVELKHTGMICQSCIADCGAKCRANCLCDTWYA